MLTTTQVYEEHPKKAQQMAYLLKHGVHTGTQIYRSPMGGEYRGFRIYLE